MGATDAREIIIANSQFGSGSTTYSPSSWWVGLSTTTPNDDGTNFTEPVGGSYAREEVLNNSTNWPAATTTDGITTKSNGVAITFTDPTGSWGTLTHYGLFTASSGGTPQFTNPLDNAVTVQSGNTPVEFAIGAIAMTWD